MSGTAVNIDIIKALSVHLSFIEHYPYVVHKTSSKTGFQKLEPETVLVPILVINYVYLSILIEEAYKRNSYSIFIGSC
jgi:hypothetical protein